MITSLIYLVIYIVVLALVLFLLNYLNDQVVPEPFHRVVRIAILVIGVLIVILLLLNFIGVIDGGAPRLAR
jgi:quinol-cytochrome oxidoreductase complex cytochrome b subunit